MSRALLVVGLALLAGGSGAARPPPRRAAGPREPPTREIEVAVIRRGVPTRYRVDGDRLTVRVSGDVLAVDRTLAAADKARLVAAARAALDARDTIYDCDGDDLFVSVVVDDRSSMNALCPQSPRQSARDAPWRALVELAGQLAGERAPPLPSPDAGPR